MLPVLLLIRHPLPNGVIFQMFEDAYVKAFRNDFYTVIGEHSCDLGQLCDSHRPDLIGFVGACSPMPPDMRTQVRNVHAHPHIPRVGFYFGDGFCSVRPSFFSDMERWGVETWFGVTHVLMEQTPDVIGRTYGLPHLFDHDIFFDQGLNRDIEFSVFGELVPWRRWRLETTQALIGRFSDAVQMNPHPGYGPEQGIGVLGRNYAARLCKSRFSIADGTIFHYLVRKHLEIPACGTVLISEPMPTLHEYGFEDMVNCVVGEGDALLDRLETLRKSPELYAAIAAAGTRLVRERHSAEANHTLHHWFKAQKELKPGQTLIQRGTFGAFEAVWDGRQGVIPAYKQAPDMLADMVALAETDYRNGQLGICLDRVNAILAIKPEFAPARLLMTRLLLRAGRPDLAAVEERGLFLFNWSRKYYGGWEHDPVELAWWVMAQLCLRNFQAANEILARFAHIRHVELRRVRWFADALQGRAGPVPDKQQKTDRPSVATHMHETFGEWVADALAVLNVCWAKDPSVQTFSASV